MPQRRGLRAAIGWSVLVAPVLGLAQVPLALDPAKPEASTQVQLGGRSAFDLLTVQPDRITLPLRYGSVRPNSETVELGGRKLVRDVDYVIDYAAGTVMLRVNAAPGSTVRVSYRYDEKSGTQGTFGQAGTNSFNALKFEFNPGNALMLGMGVTERLADGTVVQSDVYGFQNRFSLGIGQVSGLIAVGDRRRATAVNLLGDFTPPSAEIEEGKGQAIVQSLSARVGSGTVEANYQDIDTRFGGYSTFADAGFDAGQIEQFKKEAGLKRSRLAINQIGTPSLNMSAGQQLVGDATGTIEWRNAGFQIGTFKLDWNRQRVDPGFTRFGDIREGDREQLARERGLDRQTVAATLGFSGGKASFDHLRVEGPNGSGVYRRKLNLDASFVKFDYFDQSVDAGFDRFGDLREGDRDQLARERGLVRQDYSIQVPGNLPFAYRRNNVRQGTQGEYVAQDLTLSGPRFNFTHLRREASPGFTGVWSFRGDEVQSHLGAIAKMVDPGAQPQGADWNQFFMSPGLNRSLWRFDYDFGSGTRFLTDDYRVESPTGELQVVNYQFTSPKFQASFRDQTNGDSFTEFNRLIPTEQMRLGVTPGLDRTDFSVSGQLNANRKFSFSQMRAGDATGEATRLLASYADKGFSLSYVRRGVDPGFGQVGGLVDPERDLLASIRGYDQSEVNGSWQLLPSLGLQYREVDQLNAMAGLRQTWRQGAANWMIDASTQFTATQTELVNTDPTQTTVDQFFSRYALSRNFGRLGRLTLMQERADYAGVNDAAPDSTRNTLVYENQLTAATAVRTEHSETRYSNGERETLSSNTLSTNLSSRSGVSVTDTRLLRDGDKPDEVRRNYGFWLDFGKGLRFNYGLNRQITDVQNGPNQGTMNYSVGLTPGTFQDVQVGALGYQRNRWDGQRDQHIGTVSLANARPLDWGWMKDVRFYYAADTLRDMANWHRENRGFGFGGRFGAFGFGFDYRSQTNPLGDRAIDRQFAFTTDLTGKSWLRADVRYNLRTLPNDDMVMVRNYKLQATPFRNLSISHEMVTNPFRDDPNVMLGNLATETRTNKWRIDYTNDPRTKAGFVYEEFFNDNTRQLVRATGVDLVLFADNPSPLLLEYRMAQNDWNGFRQTRHQFGFRFDQRPGPNQTLSIAVNNMNWEHSRPSDQPLQRWTLRLDYGVRF